MGTRRQPTPKAAPPPQTALLLCTYVAGVKYYEFAEGDLPLDEGMALELVREPDNPYDRRAVEVYTPKGAKLGYLPRRRNQAASRLIDAGWSLPARLETVKTARPDTGRRHENAHRPRLVLSVFVPRGDAC